MPTDTYQTKLNYEVVTGKATVSQNGLVSLSETGVFEIKVSSALDSSIAKIIKIEYTDQVKRISFKKTVEQLYFNRWVDLTVIGEPLNANEFSVSFTSSNENIATVNQNGRVFAKEVAGEVTIRATVIGKEKEEVFAERTFTVIPVVDSLSLELDEINDPNGIGAYRVWGNSFVVQSEEGLSLSNNYQMTFKDIAPESAKKCQTCLENK